jgi:hypothetical protein
MGKQNAPYVVRWRNGVMDDPNPVLSWRALVAAMALTRYADVKTGHNCYPGAPKCARVMRVSVDTIQRGWAELVEAGWLEMRSRGEGLTGLASLKVLRWPARTEPTADSGLPLTAAHPTADSGLPLTAAHPTADSGSTFPGNQVDPSGPEGPPGRPMTDEAGTSQDGGRPQIGGAPEGWTAADVREARKAGLVCRRCDTVVSFFPRQAPGSALCDECLGLES